MLKTFLTNIAQAWVIIMVCMFRMIHYCLQMFLKKLETNALKYVDLILFIFIPHLKDKRPFQISVNKKVIGMSKDELGEKIMKEFCTLRAKTYTYLMENDSETKKAKGIKRCVIKRRLMFENYKD